MKLSITKNDMVTKQTHINFVGSVFEVEGDGDFYNRSTH